MRASAATGNFTTAGTWGLVDSTSYLNAETGSEVLTTTFSGTRSQSFTPGAITIDGIGVKLSVRTGTTGTMSVHLALNSDHSEVSGTLVTINCSDLPAAVTADANGGWIFFKFSAPVLLSAATAYEVEATTSSSSQISLFRDGTTDNISRFLRTTTTGAPAAGDDIIVCGAYTGAGASSTITVTMNETATTDYGAASTSQVTPALAVCSKGVLTYGTTAATNYVLRLSGNAVIYANGTLSVGTSGTPLPRDGSAVLEFDCAADGDFGLVITNLGTFNAQGLSRTSGKNIDRCLLNTDEAVNSTSLGVDTDTGWLDNDEIAIASTTRTRTECEKGTLNGNAGASSLTVDGFGGASGGLANAHSGTSPTQAEVILLTRNVRIRSVSSTAMSFVNFKATATVDCDWAEFYYLGENATGKRCLEIETTTGSVNLNRCSIHDTEDGGVYLPNSNEGAITVQNCVLYNVNSAGGTISGMHIASTSTLTTITFDANIVMLTTGASSHGMALGDIGGTITSNTIVGAQGSGITITENNTTLGTFTGNTIHSCATSGLNLGTANVFGGTIGSTTVWRCSSSGVNFQSHYVGLVFDGLTLFGNSTANINNNAGTAGLSNITFKDLVSNGDSTFSTTTGFNIANNGNLYVDILFINADFSTASGIKTAHTNDIAIAGSAYVTMRLRNCKLGASTELSGQTSMLTGSYIGTEKHDQTAGSHKTWKTYGTITIEGTTVHTGSHSIKMTPNNASNKLESGSFFIAVANGATLTPSVYVNEDASYNGARARLILKKNEAIGITSDTVIDTATAASDGAWEQLTGTTSAATDDGVMEFVVDCDGTAGNLFVDSFTVS